MANGNKGHLSAGDCRQLTVSLGVEETTTEDGPTLGEISDAINRPADPPLASTSEAVREDLARSLDAGLIERALAGLESQFGRGDEVRTAGVPGGDREAEELYRELAAPEIAADSPESSERGTDAALSDVEPPAALTGGAALSTVNQEGLMRRAFWITEEKRADQGNITT